MKKTVYYTILFVFIFAIAIAATYFIQNDEEELVYLNSLNHYTGENTDFAFSEVQSGANFDFMSLTKIENEERKELAQALIDTKVKRYKEDQPSRNGFGDISFTDNKGLTVRIIIVESHETPEVYYLTFPVGNNLNGNVYLIDKDEPLIKTLQNIFKNHMND